MNQAFKNPTQWNDFYERAWSKRQELMASIIEAGENNPLRVINKFSSILRFSDEVQYQTDTSNGETVFTCNLDSKSSLKDIRNVTIAENRNGMNVIPNKYLPGGILADIQLAHRNRYSAACSYTDCDKMDFIADYCRQRKFDAVIELGSGYSKNLIKLFYKGGPKVPYYGGEFTQSGTQCAQMLSDLTDDFELYCFRFDFCDPDLSIIPKYNKVLVFTSHAIEQVNYIPDNLVPAIANIAKQVTCIHLEPFGFQMTTPESEYEVDRNQRDNFKENGWNMNLFNQLVFHSCKEHIDLQYVGKNMMGGSDFQNPSSIALWKSGSSETN